MSDSDLDLPRTAAEARAIGSKHYFTNKPCKNGHLAKRVTANGVCRECLYAATRAWVTKTPGKSAAYTEAWRQRLLARVGQEEYNKIMNARAAKWRADHPTVGPGRGSTTLKTQEVLERFEAVHANRYVYHLPYTGMHDYMTIECDQHGEFQQTPHNHLKGAGCPKCAHGFSQPEEDIALYMESLGLEVIRRSRKIIPPLELDIYAPKIGLAVEFCGLYWHSSLHITDPKKLKTAHYDKFKRCEALGIRLITIYEDEWRDRQSQIKSIIKNSSTRDVGFGARSCVTSRISMNDASAFYEANHIQGAPRSGSSYGLHHNGELVAAMTFTQGGSQRGSRSWELIRYATKNSIAGGASRLMSKFIADESPSEIVSFSDNRYFPGGMYEKLGFELQSEIAPDYRVVYPDSRKSAHKSSFRRSAIQNRLNEIKSSDVFDAKTDPRSERQVCFDNGFGHIYDCGKKRWVWTSR